MLPRSPGGPSGVRPRGGHEASDARLAQNDKGVHHHEGDTMQVPLRCVPLEVGRLSILTQKQPNRPHALQTTVEDDFVGKVNDFSNSIEKCFFSFFLVIPCFSVLFLAHFCRSYRS